MFSIGAIMVLLLKLATAGGASAGIAKGSHWFNKKSFSGKKVGGSHVDFEHETEKRHN